jgi:hypothetical protein
MRWKIGLPLIAALGLAGCGDYDVVDKSKEVVISKQEYEKLKADAALTKQVGRFQLHRDGSRTWRLDTATGRSCLLLASEEDWKRDAGNQNSCTADDFKAAQEGQKH